MPRVRTLILSLYLKSFLIKKHACIWHLFSFICIRFKEITYRKLRVYFTKHLFGLIMSFKKINFENNFFYFIFFLVVFVVLLFFLFFLQILAIHLIFQIAEVSNCIFLFFIDKNQNHGNRNQ